MSKIKVLSVLGTRPEIIKLAPVVRELERRADRFESTTVLTGQHKEMCDPYVARLLPQADYNLRIMEPDQNPDTVVANILRALPPLLRRMEPHVVLVQGDTSSAMAAALAAYHQQIPVGHVEAGLRTSDKYSPFPEEMSRRLIGTLADFHFAPTPRARDNLIAEGVASPSVFVTGNTVIDTLLSVVKEGHEITDGLPGRIDFGGRRVICVTTHRRENFGGPLSNILDALKKIVTTFEDVEIIIPVHFNPNVRSRVYEELEGVGRIHLVDPLPYEPFVMLLSRCHLILTDSGGIQEEAPSLGKPVLVMRESTERPEGIDAGTAKLVGVDAQAIVSSVRKLLEDRRAYDTMAHTANPYGDGRAAGRIVDVLARPESWQGMRRPPA
jgi:UDP-N-acetylglucosamine 2-epimerase (non-hydrolysing)